MYETICNMIKLASKNQDYEQIENVKQLITKLAQTCNAPSNWRDIGERLKDEFTEDSWEYENLELWNH